MIVLYFLGAFVLLIFAYYIYLYFLGQFRALKLEDEILELCIQYNERNYAAIDNGQLESAFIWFPKKLPSPKYLGSLDKKPRLKDFYTPDDLDRIKK